MSRATDSNSRQATESDVEAASRRFDFEQSRRSGVSPLGLSDRIRKSECGVCSTKNGSAGKMPAFPG